MSISRDKIAIQTLNYKIKAKGGFLSFLSSSQQNHFHLIQMKLLLLLLLLLLLTPGLHSSDSEADEILDEVSTLRAFFRLKVFRNT